VTEAQRRRKGARKKLALPIQGRGSNLPISVAEGDESTAHEAKLLFEPF
jgi:hypothetical protein